MGGSYANIAGATSAAYTPVAADDGNYLRATASYTDAEGAGKSAMSTPVLLGVAPNLVNRYDTNPRDGTISKMEYLAALDDYFDGEIDRAEVLAVLAAHTGQGR